MPYDHAPNAKWLSENSHRFDGKSAWVALRNGECLGEAPGLLLLQGLLKDKGVEIDDIYFHQFFKEGVGYWLEVARTMRVIHE